MGLVKRQYDDFIWGLKYRPSKVSDIVLPDRFKNQFNKIVTSKNIPNMLFCGPRGCGKTTAAFCIADQIGCDTLYINMSKDNSIEVVRDDLTRFASTGSMFEGKKLVIGDEYDRLSIQAIDALKGDIEQFGKNCVYIFTSNDKYRFINHPVLSRVQEIDFEFTKDEMVAMKKQFYLIVCKILTKENIKFEKKAVGHMIKMLFPDMRKTLNELQKLTSQYDILTEESVKMATTIVDIDMLFGAIKDKDFTFIREYIADLSMSFSQVYSILFNEGLKRVDKENMASLIMIINENQYKSHFSLDKQIPLTACCVELAEEVKWI